MAEKIRSAAVANAEYVIAKFDLIAKGKDKENWAKEAAKYKEALDIVEAIRVKYGNDSSTDITEAVRTKANNDATDARNLFQNATNK